jgi:hypothetical protein
MLNVESHYSECRCDECHYAECCYAKYRATLKMLVTLCSTFIFTIVNLQKALNLQQFQVIYGIALQELQKCLQFYSRRLKNTFTVHKKPYGIFTAVFLNNR